MIQLDHNNPECQAKLLALDKPEAWAVLKTLRLLLAMAWEQLQRSKGLRWELIQSPQSPEGQRLYGLRISRSCCQGPVSRSTGAMGRSDESCTVPAIADPCYT